MHWRKHTQPLFYIKISSVFELFNLEKEKRGEFGKVEELEKEFGKVEETLATFGQFLGCAFHIWV